MNYLLLVLSGMVIGLIAAAPIGPVNLICIRRTLARGPVNGFFSGLGAALGDGVFAIITAFGLTAVAQAIEGFSLALQIAGGTLLLVFGWWTYVAETDPSREREKARVQEGAGSSLARAMLSTFFLTITNPATLFGFAALFAGLGGLLGEDTSYMEAGVVVAGVVAGSALWWFTLTTIIGLFHARIDAKVMRAINHLSGIAVSAFGIAVLIHAALKFL
ncbi:MAG: LysE family translocator [Alphaproteobacteria bacterium]|nr:LysE family translocator [Alphaproteobacteria bacterium]